MARLAGLFSLDAFAGGFVVQSLVAYWFHRRFGVEPAALGGIFFGANLLAGMSALVAVRVARRIGLVNTMVVTHLPSNVLLILVPLMPTLPLAVAVLFLRFSISQMDVPTRQSYTMAVVSPDERSAAAGVTGVARTTDAALSPVIAGPLFASPALMGVPFFLAGRAEDRLRPAAVAVVPRAQAAGRVVAAGPRRKPPWRGRPRPRASPGVTRRGGARPHGRAGGAGRRTGGGGRWWRPRRG